MDRLAFDSACQTIGLALSTETLDAFEAFEEALYAANEITNFTRVPREECWTRHFLDSLLIHDLIAPKAKVADIGSGPGFPAWPLACARQDIQVTALDSAGKMTGFLKKHPLPNLKVVTERAEEWEVRELFHVVTGRALAPLATQLELSARPCRIEGVILPLRTPSDEETLANCGASKLGLTLLDVLKRPLPGTDVIRMIPIFEKTLHTPNRYPRRWADIKRVPLSGS